jgi:hypothetical protein
VAMAPVPDPTEPSTAVTATGPLSHKGARQVLGFIERRTFLKILVACVSFLVTLVPSAQGDPPQGQFRAGRSSAGQPISY